MNNDHREFKDQLYDQFARIGKVLANPHRLELLDLLAQGERLVDDLAHEAEMELANASQHLQALRRARLVEVRRAGTAIYYRLADPRVVRLSRALREVAETRLAEIDRLTRIYLTDRDHLEAIDAATLVRRLRDEDVVLIDVRPPEEYRAGHLPGARSVPVAELAERLDELPRDRAIVAYCRGPYCVFADEAVTLLQARGYRAARLVEGLPEWQEAGLPVER
jgi:rhodanese-related sulfurtransferase/DNA-binding transcriptional ArsR family regulator